MTTTAHDLRRVSAKLPIIDLSELNDPARHAAFYENLRLIARDTGFFYLIGHGIDVAKFRAIEQETRKFFRLPRTAKQRIAMANSPHFRGYTAVGEEITRLRHDYREQIDIGAELPALAITPASPAWERLQGPNQWPEELPEFKKIVLDWQARARALTIRFLKALLVALEQPKEALDELITGTPAHLLKLIHYPGSNAHKEAQGVGPHKDSGILTLLLQDDVGGLQVETDDGWIDAPPLRDAFIVNIGEVLELVTNGYLRANVHRVVTPKAGVDRYSIAYFLSPRLDAGEVPLLALPEHLARQARGPESDPANPLFSHVGINTLKGRLRSHPDVTQRFYPEQYAELLAASGEQAATHPPAY